MNSVQRVRGKYDREINKISQFLYRIQFLRFQRKAKLFWLQIKITT